MQEGTFFRSWCSNSWFSHSLVISCPSGDPNGRILMQLYLKFFMNTKNFRQEIVECLIVWWACYLTTFIHSLTGPVGQPFASRHEGPGSIPRGVLMWNWDSPVSVVLLHWWPRRDWSLWPHLRRASSRTITRLLCQQCDNPTWSHTALLSRFHARCRYSFRLHNRHSRLLGEPCGEPAISLHSYTISLVKWVNPLLPVLRDPGSIPRGYLCETRILLLALSHYNSKHFVFDLSLWTRPQHIITRNMHCTEYTI